MAILCTKSKRQKLLLQLKNPNTQVEFQFNVLFTLPPKYTSITLQVFSTDLVKSNFQHTLEQDATSR